MAWCVIPRSCIRHNDGDTSRTQASGISYKMPAWHDDTDSSLHSEGGQLESLRLSLKHA